MSTRRASLFRPARRRLLAVAGILVAAAAFAVAVVTLLDAWKERVIAANLEVSERAAAELAETATPFFDEVAIAPTGEDPRVTELPRESLDRRLVELAERTFARHRGVKGGFWLPHLGEFLGYADPTSPPPKPAFGPPPRSYQIILDQVRESIARGEALTRLHQFDPAVFTLATTPVQREGQVVAVVWARVHIERELPATRLGRYLQYVVVLTLFAFMIVLVVTLHQQREIRSLNAGLDTIARDPAHRLPARSGMFGSIRDSINAMLDSLESAHQERKELQARLHHREKMVALGNMLAGMAHEVKTPLAVLKTRVQIWQRDLARFTERTGEPSPLSDDSIQLVLGEINRLSDLLNKLLYFSRPSDPDERRLEDVDDLLRHTVLFVKPRLLQQKIDLDVDLASGAAKVLGDAGGLHQVFLNLLTNSLQAMEQGGRLHVTSRRDEQNDTVRIDIRDSGSGIPPEILDKVFDPFFTTRHSGTGLGLSIAYELIRAHGGEIRFREPEDGRGAHCTIHLPLAGEDAEQP